MPRAAAPERAHNGSREAHTTAPTRAGRRPWSTATASPLLPLLLLVAVLGVAWALLAPPWQAPDEPAHFAYVQSLAERGSLPGDAARLGHSTEQDTAATADNAYQLAGNLSARPPWSRTAYDRWAATAGHAPSSTRRDGGGPNPASTNPPLYYLYGAGVYELARGGTIWARMSALRLANVVWLLVTVAATWLLAGELFGRNRLLQTAAASLPGLLPMMTFITASVSPDGLMYALWSLALWLGVRALRRGPDARTLIALCAVVGLAAITKTTSYGLLPGLAFVLLVSLARGLPRPSPLALAGCAAALVLPVALWLGISHASGHTAATAQVTDVGSSHVNTGQFLSYLWQFYLPRLPNLRPLPALSHLAVYEVWIKMGWAAFGWLEIRFPEPVYGVLAGVTALVAVAAVAYVVRNARRIGSWYALAFLAICGLALLFGLHWTDVHKVVAGQPFMQGRYAFPVVAIGGVALAAAIGLVPRRARPAAVGLAIGLLLVLQVASLGLVTGRFFA